MSMQAVSSCLKIWFPVTPALLNFHLVADLYCFWDYLAKLCHWNNPLALFKNIQRVNAYCLLMCKNENSKLNRHFAQSRLMITRKAAVGVCAFFDLHWTLVYLTLRTAFMLFYSCFIFSTFPLRYDITYKFKCDRMYWLKGVSSN